jgi:thiamine monophosphate kinase
MDLSDGLIEFLYTIKERSGLGVTLDERQFPISSEMIEAAVILEVRPTLLALEAGYDTPLTHGWTVTPEAWPMIQESFRRHGAPIFQIGHVTKSREILLVTDKGMKSIEPFWDDQFCKDSVIERWFQIIKAL